MEDVRDKIAEFVLNDLLLGDDRRMPGPEESLLESGAIDSTGILELIEFLESELGVHVDDDETVPENLDGIDRIASYVARKRAAGQQW